MKSCKFKLMRQANLKPLKLIHTAHTTFLSSIPTCVLVLLSHFSNTALAAVRLMRKCELKAEASPVGHKRATVSNRKGVKDATTQRFSRCGWVCITISKTVASKVGRPAYNIKHEQFPAFAVSCAGAVGRPNCGQWPCVHAVCKLCRRAAALASV